MATKGIEVELKIPVDKKTFDNVRKLLESKAKFISSSQEVDKYFNSHHRNFLKVKHPVEYLRVREKGNSGSFTYKYQYFSKEGEHLYADEHETKVDTPSELIKILEVLNFDNFITINKKRETYVYKNDYEFELDEVKDLGYFIEIEAKKDFEGQARTLDKLKEIALKLGIDTDKRDNDGYVVLMMKKKGML